MAVDYMASGKIKGIIYFINSQGHIMLLPTDEDSKRFRKRLRDLGYEMQVAETLADARKLQKELQRQLQNEQLKEIGRDEMMTYERRRQVKERLTNRMNSASCSQYERDFIRIWLSGREQRHDNFVKRFTAEVGNLDILEFDDPDKHIHDLHDRVPNSNER